jgi:predicted RNA binding protein YcfA (HicA-like mRNA interferase family)
MARLKSEGWISRWGANHEVFVHPERLETMIPVRRDRKLTPLTARSIAKAPGWV